jgi:peptidoglycan-associated lipoprotein
MIKLNPFIRILALATLLALPTVGCKKTPTNVTNLPNNPNTGQPFDPNAGKPIANDTPNPETSGGLAEPGRDKYAGWPADAELLKADTVHFDFDSSSVKNSEKSKVMAVASYIKANSANAIRVEGHCDERGTEEYNRALGVRRAVALREELVRDGVDPEKVITLSYGEDKPVDPGHNEAAWRKNRRGEFIVLSPPK